MAASITYNGTNPFGQYPPLIERSEVIVDNNGYISHADRFVLSGFLIKDICVTTWAQYYTAAKQFLDLFSRNFGIFRVFDGASLVFENSNSIIRNITFEDSSFYNLVPYNISIDCIRSYENLGIIDPVDEWTTSQGEDSLINISHKMSCRGVGESAFDNAKAFIEGLRSVPASYSISESVFNLPLLSRQESKNRLTGEYSLTETFLYNEDDPSATAGILTYTSELSENQGQTTVIINGTIQENTLDQAGNELTLARSKFDVINWDAIAATIYGSTIDKNAVSVTEDAQKGVVTFSLTYDSLASNSPYLIDETTITRDLISGRDCISLRLTVRMDYGCVGSRFEIVKAYAEALNFNSIVAQKWAKFGPGGTLGSVPESKGWSENPIDGTVSLSVQYCTKTSKECGCLQNFDYSLDFAPSANQYVSYPIYRAAGLYDVQNLRYLNRTRYGINGSAVVSKCCSNEQAKTELAGRVNAIANFYFPGTDRILEESNITTTSNEESLNFSFRWSVAPF